MGVRKQRIEDTRSCRLIREFVASKIMEGFVSLSIDSAVRERSERTARFYDYLFYLLVSVFGIVRNGT